MAAFQPGTGPSPLTSTMLGDVDGFLLYGPRGRTLCYSTAISAFIFQLWQTESGIALS